MNGKHLSFPSLTGTNNTNWETAAVHTSVAEEDILNATGRFSTPVEVLGCTNSPRYHAVRFHIYRNCPKKRDLDVSERSKQYIQ